MQVAKPDWGTKKFILGARWSKFKSPFMAKLHGLSGLEVDWSNWKW